jgi:hypothetical protein
VSKETHKHPQTVTAYMIKVENKHEDYFVAFIGSNAKEKAEKYYKEHLPTRPNDAVELFSSFGDDDDVIRFIPEKRSEI